MSASPVDRARELLATRSERHPATNISQFELHAPQLLADLLAEVGRLERERDGLREALETIRGGVVELADGLGPLRTQLNRINTTAIRYVEDAIRDALTRTEGPADGRDE